MWLFKKDMYQYNLFERVKIDFMKEQQNSKVKVEKVCDNDKYIFYKYTPDDVLHYTYIVGQLKKNPKKIYYFGQNFEYICECLVVLAILLLIEYSIVEIVNSKLPFLIGRKNKKQKGVQ